MGTDKALLAVEGVPIAVRVAAALSGAGAAPIVAIGGDLGALAALGLAARPDPRQGEGPLGGLLSAFEALPGAEVVAVVACDLPWLTAPVVAAVVGALAAEPDAPVAAAVTERAQTLCAAWRPAFAAGVLTAAFAAGERSIRRAWAPLRPLAVPVDPAALRDVDAPTDLTR
jgi:molybdopterin-guanine dinucleotide biosynthesis protein A